MKQGYRLIVVDKDGVLVSEFQLTEQALSAPEAFVAIVAGQNMPTIIQGAGVVRAGGVRRSSQRIGRSYRRSGAVKDAPARCIGAHPRSNSPR